MGRRSFIIHLDSLAVLDDLTDEEAGKLFKAIKNHHEGAEVNEIGVVKVAFSPFKNQFERDNARYEKICEQRALSGAKGGQAKASKSKQVLAKASKSKQTVANLADNDNDNVNDSDNDSDNKIVKSTNVDCRLSVAHLVNDIFEYWASTMNKDTSLTKLTDKRRKAISDRLKDGFTVNQIKQAIDGCAKDPFSMGQNDRKKPFNDIELICRSGEKLQFFAESSVRVLSAAERSAQSDWLTPESMRDL